MPFEGEKREARVNYVCHHCQRQGIGFKTEVYRTSSHGGRWVSDSRTEKSVPPNWRTFGMGVHLCDRCADNPEATQAAEKNYLIRGAVVTGLVVIALIIYGIYSLVTG